MNKFVYKLHGYIVYLSLYVFLMQVGDLVVSTDRLEDSLCTQQLQLESRFENIIGSRSNENA